MKPKIHILLLLFFVHLININAQENSCISSAEMIIDIGCDEPTAICQDISVVLDENGMAQIAEDVIDNGSTAPNGILSMNTDITIFDCSDIGEVTLILTLTDSLSNISHCSAIAMVIDDLPPTFECNNETLYFCSNEAINFDAPQAKDNCSVNVTQTAGPDSGSAFSYGLTQVTFEAKDPSNNTAECDMNIVRFEPITFISENNDFSCEEVTYEYKFSLQGGWPGYDTEQIYMLSVNSPFATFDNYEPYINEIVTMTIDGLNAPSGTVFSITAEDKNGCKAIEQYTTDIGCCAHSGSISTNNPCPAIESNTIDYFEVGEYLILDLNNIQNSMNYSTSLIITDEIDIILQIIDLSSSSLPSGFNGDPTNSSPNLELSYANFYIDYAYWSSFAGEEGKVVNMYILSEANESPADPAPVVGEEMAFIGQQGGCYDLSNIYTIYLPATLKVEGSIDDGNYEGVYSSYNYFAITITGGYQQYQYKWNTEGYVNYALVGNELVNISYAPDAAWSVTITDAQDCGGDNLFIFVENDIVPNTLAIVDKDILPEINSQDNGAIDLTLEGGTEPYTFVWSGLSCPCPDNEDIFGLTSGWYGVEVTDSGNPQQSVTGHYWVPNVKGYNGIRGKEANNKSFLEVIPNPVKDYGLVNFSSPVTDYVYVSLYAIDGRKVGAIYEGQIEKGMLLQEKLNTGQLAAGIYFVEMQNSKREQLAVIKVSIMD